MNHIIDLRVKAVQLVEVVYDCDIAVDIDCTVVVTVAIALIVKHDHTVLLGEQQFFLEAEEL